LIILAAICVESYNLPQEIKITKYCEKIELNSRFPLTARIISNNENSNKEKYRAQIKLMNIFPVKTLDVEVVNEKIVVVGGNPFGIKIFTEGVVIVGFQEIETSEGSTNPASEAGLQPGDAIIKIDDKKVDSNKSVDKIVKKSEGNSLTIIAKRNNETFITQLKPRKSVNDGYYRAGIWVRDSSAGIGTMTYYDPDTKTFAGLGHGVCDIDVDKLLPLGKGDVVSAKVNNVSKGTKGKPGELQGHLEENFIGTLSHNTHTGVFGDVENFDKETSDKITLPIAMKQEVKKGKAQIFCTISGNKIEQFDAEIIEVNYKEDSPTKNMIIIITDQRLLNKTGGIVQGMSGSPIIKDGKLIGAITHVFVNEPQKGYAIFAEKMFKDAEHMKGFFNLPFPYIKIS
jgi:stage IV sporulation protein B